ncbi:MAG: addiction module protein [Methylacidiphilales bacterium]|nr:addiction module protein [Candidatus Methylacidiphilales bacterium]
MSITQIKEMALALPVEQRVDLAQPLWSSLENHPSDITGDEAAFQDELKRRDQEMSADPSSCSSHEEVMTEARRRIGS